MHASAGRPQGLGPNLQNSNVGIDHERALDVGDFAGGDVGIARCRIGLVMTQGKIGIGERVSSKSRAFADVDQANDVLAAIEVF